MRSSGPESADSRDWVKAITRQVAARRKEGSSGPWQSAREREWRGLSPIGPQSTHPDADAASRAGWSCPFRVRTLSGPVAAREVHEAGTDRYPGQEGREPPPGLGLLDHPEHLRGDRPVDERGRPGRAGSVAVAAGVLPGLALGDLLAEVALAAGLAARRAVRLRATFVAPLAPAFAAVVLFGMTPLIVSAGSYPDRGRRQPWATGGACQPGVPGKDASASTRRLIWRCRWRPSRRSSHAEHRAGVAPAVRKGLPSSRL